VASMVDTALRAPLVAMSPYKSRLSAFMHVSFAGMQYRMPMVCKTSTGGIPLH
jgi:hypothetical protein